MFRLQGSGAALRIWRRGHGFLRVFQSGMCDSAAAAAAAEEENAESPESRAVAEGLEKYLFTRKKMPLDQARIIACNASSTVQQVLDSLRAAHGEFCDPRVIEQNVASHLGTMGLDSVLLFYDSLGMNPKNPSEVAKLRNLYEHVFSLTKLLEEIGVERKAVGNLLLNNSFVLEGEPSQVKNLILYLHSNHLSKDSFQVLCMKFPEIFTPGMKRHWEPFLHVLREYEVQELALRRLVMHFGGLLKRLPESDYARIVDYLLTVVDLEKADVARIIKYHPECLLMDLSRIQAKVDFLRKYQVKKQNLTRVFARCPSIVGLSVETLEQKIEYLRSVGVREYRMKRVLVRFPKILAHSVENKLKPTVEQLQGAGLSMHNIGRLLIKRPAVFAIDNKLGLPSVLEFLKDLGEEGTMVVLCWGLSEGIHPMKARVTFLKSLGLSTEDLVKMLYSDPRVLKINLAGLRMKVRFLTEEMGFSTQSLVGNPSYLYSHFERRIKLRWAVLKLLHEKGAMPIKPQLSQIVYPDNKDFIQRYVNPYRECVVLVKKHYKLFQMHPDSAHKYVMKYVVDPILEGETRKRDS